MMKTQKFAILNTALLFTLCSHFAVAQGNPNSFGGACASQGQWTSQALEASKRIQAVVENFSNDPNCAGFGKTIQSAMKASATELQAIQADTKMGRLVDIPAELQALRAMGREAGAMRGDVIKLLMDRGLEGARVATEVGMSYGAPNVAQGLMSLGERVKRVGTTSMHLFEAIVNEAPNLDKCLVGQQSAGHFYASAINLASSFVSSGQTYSSQFASLLSKFTASMRARKFSQVIGLENSQELLASLSCLVETTTESYCSARDNRYLFEKGIRDIQIRSDKNNWTDPLEKDGLAAENPFQGYYILSNQVPVVTGWLQKIQIGVDPKLPTDADFQSRIIDDVAGHLRKTKILQGNFSQRRKTIEDAESLAARQNATLQLLQFVTDAIRRENGINFFTMAMQEIYLPFYLIGWTPDQVPAVVAGADPNRPPMDWDQWMASGGSFKNVPEFKNPNTLVETMERQLNDLIVKSTIEANKYYTSWFIVDKPSLVNESVTGFRYTVTDSLKQIDTYLTTLKAKVIRHKGDASILVSITDTQNRIRRVLKAYEPLNDLKDIKMPFGEEDEKRILAAFKNIVETVYTEFNVLLQRSGFIANRLLTFVNYDYSLMLKKKVDFTKYEEELFFVTGQAIIERMVSFYSGNPAHVKTDLELAMRINKENINGLEMLLKDTLIQQMVFLKRVTEGKSTREWAMYWDSKKRLFQDTAYNRIIPKDLVAYNNGNSIDKTQWQEEDILNGSAALMWSEIPILNIPMSALSMMSRYQKYEDRYNTRIGPYTVPQSTEDEFGSAGQVLAKLCVQSLAFQDWKAFIPYCDKQVLKSFIQDVEPKDGDNLAIKWNMKLSEGYKPNDKQTMATNMSQRICAFRDYGRRNHVFWLTLLMEKNQLDLQ